MAIGAFVGFQEVSPGRMSVATWPGAVIAAVGGAIYIAIAVLSLLFGEKKEASSLTLVAS